LKNEITWKAALRDELPVYETCRSLKVLNLSYNRISCKGVQMMAKELKDDEHMRSLILRANCIGKLGVKTVRKLLK
jgi:Ran GTPase-activating protein (RanGAP) involved in mRNA processing and transport